MRQSDKYSAIQFVGKRIIAAEIVHAGEEFEVTSIIEREGSENYSNGFPAVGDVESALSENLLSDLRLTREAGDIDAPNISICLDSRWVFIHTFPLDEGISDSERARHIVWELSNYLGPSTSKNYITGTAELGKLSTPETSLLLSASVKRELVAHIRQTTARLGLRLAVIDVDHFGAEHALRWNYPEIEDRAVALFGIKPNRVEATVLHAGKPVEYRWQELIDGDSGGRFLEHLLSQRSNGKPLLGKIFVYSEDRDPWKSPVFDSMIPIPVEPLDPTRRVRLSRRLIEKGLSGFQQYAPVIGLAMRRE